MKKTFAFVAGIVVSLISNTFAAQTERAINIKSDAGTSDYALDITREDSGEISLLTLHTDAGATPIRLDDLQKPFLLEQMSGHGVIFLSIEHDFIASKGGHAVVRYLNSGVGGDTFRNFRILIELNNQVVLRSDPNPEDPESDHNTYSGQFNELFLKKRTFLGQTIGIAQVEPSYH